MPAPAELADRLARYGQEHLLSWWDDLNDASRQELTREINALDLDRLESLTQELVNNPNATAIDPQTVKPVEVARLPYTDGERSTRRILAEQGAKALRAGEIAVVVVAGGQGTRLGFEGPKGTYPIGPVSGASLFQIHAEKIVALGKRYGRMPSFYVMTSPDNHDTTIQFFTEHNNFGLNHVRFFVQGQMPAVDKNTCKILLASPDHIALSPDGHGGTLKALAEPGLDGGLSCLEEMKQAGVHTIYYYQVDNPFVQIADPLFLGLHRQHQAEMSFKVVEKIQPDEKLGLVVQINGVTQVIEYSDLDPELAQRRNPEGGLELWAGSIAVHLLEREFVERLMESGGKLPFHRAVKKVPYVNSDGQQVQPDAPNAIKFETFIFDALPLAKRFAIMETSRQHEFEPLKNASGPDSPASVRQRMSELFADWLETAGATVHRLPDGSIPFDIEISPLYANDAAELKSKLPANFLVDRSIYLR